MQVSQKFIPSRIYAIFLEVVLVITFLLLSLIALPSLSAHATTNIPAAKCIVTWIYLHGHNPATIICHQWRTGTAKVPDTQTGPCGNENAFIDSYDNGTVCFIGSGYLGFYACCTHVFNVEFIRYGEWVTYYYHGSYPGKR